MSTSGTPTRVDNYQAPPVGSSDAVSLSIGISIGDPHPNRPPSEVPSGSSIYHDPPSDAPDTLLVSSGPATATNDLHPPPSPDISVSSPTGVSSTLRLPIEVCEMIMDFFLEIPNPNGTTYNDRDSLAACSLVCKAWQHRARFHLCVTVILTSGQHFLSFIKFLSARPHLCTRVAYLILWGHPYNQSTEPQDDSWISSVPLMLPALPNLKGLTFRRIDFSQQHAIFDKAFAKFKHTSKLELVYFTDYRGMSSGTFACCARLAELSPAMYAHRDGG
ncbi:hypothetical protein EUX98_g6093 [Antrodiella citrinella]|uniref:F-box domain-containing protein n=1 Tax=Antrodiella citrinella TaxID=2447956 RepID=A0A4S4MPW2_9APHY|nr:hypothetical protein EUX98_g6093 [Antrodiella citrinella]